MNDDIIKELKGQHVVLVNDLNNISNLIDGSDKFDADEILRLLKSFNSNLAIHLLLENNKFYSALLGKMKAHEMDTDDMERFIDEMSGIGVVVNEFIDKFSSAHIITNEKDVFIEEFQEAKKVLAMRIEAEETGAYDLWLSFSATS